MLNRRQLFQGSALSALLATLHPGVRVAFGAQSTAPIVILVSCLGAQDGLSLVGPTEDTNYIAARTAATRIVSSGASAGILLGNGNGPPAVGGTTPVSNDWHIHPGAPELAALYNAGHLAIVHASGPILDSRSHQDMTERLQAGVPMLSAQYTLASGWMGRYLTTSGAGGGSFTAVTTNGGLPITFNGFNANDAQAIPSIGAFNLSYGGKTSQPRLNMINAAYGTVPSNVVGSLNGALRTAGTGTTAAVTAFQAAVAGYKTTDVFSNAYWPYQMSIVAELIKLQLGVQMVEVGFDGWDSHAEQQTLFNNNVPNLSKGIAQLYTALANASINFIIVTASEFGRRVQENAGAGTDHGHGGVMLVAGPGVKGGKIYGSWPGLAPTHLDDGDLVATTENRAVFAEILSARGRTLDPSVFPALAAYTPLGLFG